VSIAKEDHYFLMNLKSQIQSEFDYKLNKVEKLVEKIDLQYFDKAPILNYNLLDFILGNDQYIKKQDLVFEFLKNEESHSISFIEGFINNGIKTELFFKALCKKWKNIWNYIESSSMFTEARKEKYFKLLMEYADILDIKDISDLSSLRQVILSKKDFLSVIPDKKKLKEIIFILSLKFVDIDDTDSSKEMIEFIYNKNYYSINLRMLKILIKARGNFNQVEFDTKNYFSINNSNCDKLSKYINENINEYAVNVYLKLPSNKEEDEKNLIDLLNTNKLLIENQTSIIKQVQTKISGLSNISDMETEYVLMRESKVQPTWENVIEHYINNESEIPASLVTFINNLENASILSNIKIEKENPDKETASKFIKDLLLDEDIKNENYALIIKSIPYVYHSLNFDILSKEKVSLLIQFRRLKLNSANYDLLKANFNNLHILLLENMHIEFIRDIKLYSIDQYDANLILNSQIFTIHEKNEIVNSLEDKTLFENIDLLKSLGQLILSNNTFNVSKFILMSILTKSPLPINDKLKLFIIKSSLFDCNDISEILILLPNPFSHIAKKGKRPFIESSDVNKKFIQILKNKNYISKYELEKKGFRISTFRN